MEIKTAEKIKALLEDKKANNIKMLDVSKLTTICDIMIIADGSNINHLDTLVDAVYDGLLKEDGLTPRLSEGNKNSGWVLLDYNDVIVQLFTGEMREFYDLERIWSDATII